MRWANLLKTSGGLVLAVSWAALLQGCVSKSTAQAQARAAYLAGQNAALMQMQQQPQGPSVRFVGQVNNPIVPWSDGLTLARAIMNAGYFGPAEPASIVVRREGQQFPIDPNRLLNGEDFPVQAGDLIELRP